MRDKRISDCRFTARKRLIRKLKSMLMQHFYIFISLCLKKKDETKTVIGHMMENQSGLEVGTAIRALRVHHTVMWVKIVDYLKEDFPRID